MNPFDTQFLTQDRIADLMRASSDLHRGPEGGGFASRIAAVLAVPRRWSASRHAADASAAGSVGPHPLGGAQRP